MEKGQPFRNDMLPRKCDVIRHVWFHGNGKATGDAVSVTSNDLIEIWDRADCPPKSRKHVVKQLNELITKEYRRPNQLEEKRNFQRTLTRKSDEVPAEKP